VSRTADITELATSLLYELFDPLSFLSFVSREVVHDHHPTLTQTRCKDPLDVGLEDLAVGRALHGERWSHPLVHAHARKQRGVLATVAGHRAVSPLCPFLAQPYKG
jgi:hypothetical protein